VTDLYADKKLPPRPSAGISSTASPERLRRYAGGEPLAEVVRSDFVESRHSGSVVLLDASGEVQAWAGDVLGPVFPRSSNKPLQAAGMVGAGLQLVPEELALVAASHRGQPFHIAGVRAILGGAGLDEGLLGCPADYPLADEARDDVVRAGGRRAPVLMNCSGKHAGMLRTCQLNGWPLEGYLAVDHPLQERLATVFATLTGGPVPTVGVDGCGAPVLATSLRGLATAFLAMVHAPEGAPERDVADAMRAFPDMVSGTDADAADSHLMRAVPGLVVKGGAEGVLAAAVPGKGAVALKVDDGAMRPRIPVLLSALARLGVRVEVPEQGVYGGGRLVGVVRSVW
jgi:L-asparaginase II